VTAWDALPDRHRPLAQRTATGTAAACAAPASTCDERLRFHRVDPRPARPSLYGSRHRPAHHPEEEAVMAYVDGFVLPVPKANVEAYRKIARKAGKIWLEYGALEYVECVADDVQPGKLTSFPQAVKLKPDEVVVFSWILYRSRAQRDKVNKQVMADPRLNALMSLDSMPFDGKRMFWGGFKPIVQM
jgi:uncharacterized protein YbaA (DUF1428 family)